VNELHDSLLVKHPVAAALMIRGARNVAGWSQTELARRASLTQRSIHKLEQGAVRIRKSNAFMIEQVFGEVGIHFEELADGSFKISIDRECLASAPIE
jgi:transcriptional regulator with XRE-family HTH domain